MESLQQQEHKRPELRGVQVLRGLAACMVVVYHASARSTPDGNGIAPAGWPNGAAGVDIFFVISGLVMAVSTIGREHITHPAWNFLKRRLVRIVPLYWIMTALALLQILINRSHGGVSHPGRLIQTPVAYIVSSFLFIPYQNSLGTIQPVLVSGWTLSFEMFFYLLFALALAVRVSVARLLTPVMLVLAAVGVMRRDDWPSITVLLSPLLLEFLAGLLLGVYVLNGLRINRTLCACLGIASLAALLFVPVAEPPDFRILRWGIPAALLVLAIVMLEDRLGSAWPRWALLIGDASYSIYLSHLFVISILAKIFKELHVLTPGEVRPRFEIVTILLALGGSIAVSIPLYYFVEKPMNEKLRNLTLSSSRRGATAVKVL